MVSFFLQKESEFLVLDSFYVWTLVTDFEKSSKGIQNETHNSSR